MAREIKENAHNRTDLKKLRENWDLIDWGDLKEKPIEKKVKSKHITAGLCGEYGMSTFDEKAFKENFEQICCCSVGKKYCSVHKEEYNQENSVES